MAYNSLKTFPAFAITYGSSLFMASKVAKRSTSKAHGAMTTSGDELKAGYRNICRFIKTPAERVCLSPLTVAVCCITRCIRRGKQKASQKMILPCISG